jgi:hypothetical protein
MATIAKMLPVRSLDQFVKGLALVIEDVYDTVVDLDSDAARLSIRFPNGPHVTITLSEADVKPARSARDCAPSRN